MELQKIKDIFKSLNFDVDDADSSIINTNNIDTLRRNLNSKYDKFFDVYAVHEMREKFENSSNKKYTELSTSDYQDGIIPERFKDSTKSLDAMIDLNRDFLFGAKGLKMIEMYCKSTKHKSLEPPQLVYLRVAMYLSDTLEEVKSLYDSMSLHQITLATPIMVESAGDSPRTLSSCLLSTVEDNTEDIAELASVLGVQAARGSGIAIDFSRVRTKGSKIGIDKGDTPGMIPFIKMYEQSIVCWRQNNKRKASACLYYPWYSGEIFDLIQLRNNGGIEETRARRLKYAVKINDYFIKQIENDGEISLIDGRNPFCLEDRGLWGEEFENKYKEITQNLPKIKARDLWKAILKHRIETGNIYLFFEDTVNKSSMLNEYIGSSNLCCEVVLPTKGKYRP